MAVIFAVLVASASLALGWSASASAAGSGTSSSATCPWLNQSLSIGQRVRMLLAQMTLPDKINMVTGAGFSSTYVFGGSVDDRR